MAVTGKTTFIWSLLQAVMLSLTGVHCMVLQLAGRSLLSCHPVSILAFSSTARSWTDGNI